MNEETTLDTGSQEVAQPVAMEAAPAAPVAQQEVAQPVSEVSWLDGLDEAYRENPLINKWETLNDFAKTHLNAQKLIGAEKVAIPGKSATNEEWQSLYQRLGSPKDPNEYDLDKTEVFDEATYESFKNTAYEIGLSNKQASAIAAHFEKQVNDGRGLLAQQVEEARFNGEQELRQEFGQHFVERLTQAQAAAKTVMPDVNLFEVALADGRKLGDHPDIIKAFSSMAEMLGEDGLVGEPTDVVMSAADAKQRYNELVAANTPYWDKFHPEHQSFIDEALHLRSYF
jgi:hypothetical protein